MAENKPDPNGVAHPDGYVEPAPEDYEAGTWTPKVVRAAPDAAEAAGGAVYSGKAGTYTKVGDVVPVKSATVLPKKPKGGRK